MYHAIPGLPVTIPTHRLLMAALVEPWIQLRSLVANALARRQAGAMEDTLLGLDGLSPQMLRDIGFAAWQVEQAEVRRAREVERWLW